MAHVAARRAQWEQSATLPGFDPRMVPEIAAGYYWIAGQATGLGTAAFRVPEGNGKSGADFAQATVASQPTQLAENGSIQFRMRKAADSNPSPLLSAAFSAGWTGATYLGMWRRFPDASGDITGVSNVFIHGNSGGNNRLTVLTSATTSDRMRIVLSSDGTVTASTDFATPYADGLWHWIECIFDPALTLGGATSADYAKCFADFAQLTPIATATNPSSIKDSLAAARVNTSTGGSAGADNNDWAAVYYGNGIPVLFHRQRLMAHRAPIATAFC